MMTSSNGNIFRVTGPLCGEFTGLGEFPTQRTVTRSFAVFFDLRLNKRLSKQPWGWWFEPPSWSLWRHRNDVKKMVRIPWSRSGTWSACPPHVDVVTFTWCVGKLTIIGSDNGSSAGRRQAIIWIGGGILLIALLGTNFGEIFIGFLNVFIQDNALGNVVCEMASILSRPQCGNFAFGFHMLDYLWVTKYYQFITHTHTYFVFLFQLMYLIPENINCSW